MSGRGKGSKGAKSIAKKSRRATTSDDDISKPAIMRLARRAGVGRVGFGCINEIRVAAKGYMTAIIDYAFVYANHAKRKTITCSDVLYALKKTKKPLMDGWLNENGTDTKSEWDDQQSVYDNLNYKNEWIYDQKQEEETSQVVINELYEKLQLDYTSFFEGPKLFHQEQSRRRRKE